MKKKKDISIKEAMQTSNSVRLFENDFLESLSHVHPVTPFVIYIPVVVGALLYAVLETSQGILGLLGYSLAGMVFWTLVEYVLHRFLFHIPHEKSKITKAIYFYTHGMHHDVPDDATRLVMPPGASLPLAVGFFFLFRAVLPVGYLPFFAGFIAGYLIYDFLHFASHFFTFKNRYFKFIRKNHMIHHYRAPLKNFGFTSPIWDFVGFSYFKSENPKADEQLSDRSGLKPL